MMTKMYERSYRIFLVGLLSLILGCAGFGNLCGWLMIWCLGMTSSRQMILAMILTVIFVFTIIKQIWRTYQYTKQFLHITGTEFPQHVQKLLADLEINLSTVVLLESSVPFAFCFGFVRPRICLSTGLVTLLSTPQLRATLCHEDYHRRRFDPLRILLIEGMGTTLWFLPAVREWRSLVRIKLELNADDYAVHKVGKSALAGALHSLLIYSSESQSLMQGTVIAGMSANTARIAALLGERTIPQQISRRSLVLSFAIILGICCFFLQ